MRLENRDGVIYMEPGPIDVHGHGRAFDPLPDGKAGLAAYTQTMLASGIVAVNLMPNESRREIDPLTNQECLTETPVSNLDRVGAMKTAIGSQAVTRASFYVGIDRREILRDQGTTLDAVRAGQLFQEAGQDAAGAKLWVVNNSVGGMAVDVDQAAQLTFEWNSLYRPKPVIYHAEDGNVDAILREVEAHPGGKDIPIHIAHVSSEEELTAKIEAKARGMRVTCEATPHHLFTTAEMGLQIGGFGCMKPKLQTRRDVEFLWDNMDEIDVFASDCAPHRRTEKQADPPAFGVTNHTVMLPLLFGAVADGRLTLDDLYEKVAIAPRRIFGLPLNDETAVRFDTNRSYMSVAGAERAIMPLYGENIFYHLEKLDNAFHLEGVLEYARSGASEAWFDGDTRRVSGRYKVSLRNLVHVRVDQ